MKGLLIAGLLGAVGGITLGLLDSMTDRTLATVLGLALTAVAFVAFSLWAEKR